jgi:phage terminase large subunit-like protein
VIAAPTAPLDAYAEAVGRHAADRVARSWRRVARPEQLPPPGDWRVWLVMAGRGWGKTRAGAEWTIESARAFPLVNIVGATADDARDIMIEGESGILAKAPPSFRPDYQPSKRRIDWPNGARTLVFTADEPERLRGKQHMRLWCDELASWRYGSDAWDQAMFGLRLGADPRAVVTTTPKRVRALRDLIADPATVVTGGATYANRANLAPAFFAQIIRRYEGTSLGRQELGGELLDEVEGAHWTHALIEASRVTAADVPPLRRVVVGVDPQGQAGIGSETGIVAAGVGRPEGATVDHAYVLADASGDLTPDGWARAVVGLYRRLAADRIVAEANFGGQMVGATIRTVDPGAPIELVGASRGKLVRAEPVAALYEQGRARHVGGFPALEDEMTGFDGTGPSPNRMDALVWAVTALGLAAPAPPRSVAPAGVAQKSTWGPAR